MIEDTLQGFQRSFSYRVQASQVMKPYQVDTMSGWHRWEWWTLVIRLHAPENVQDCKEQVEDVKVKPNRRPDVLVIGVALNQALCVIENEA
jgi:hypothetical protein